MDMNDIDVLYEMVTVLALQKSLFFTAPCLNELGMFFPIAFDERL